MSEQINTENVVQEVKTVVTETVPEAVTETVETVTRESYAEAIQEPVEESKSKSFFDIFKKDKPAEEATEAPAADDATEAAAAEGTETPAEEVPVDNAPAKKGRLCGLCACGKKKEAEPAEEVTPVAEEAAPVAEEVAPAAEEVAPAAEEVAPATEEATTATEEAVSPVVAAAATEEAAETTEGEAVALAVEADVARSGLLFKSGKFFKSNMNERHCRLLSTGVFQYSKTEDFTKAHECKVCAETTTVAFMADGEDTPHKYRFELHCCGTVSTYACDTEEDRDEWVRAIETVKESVVPAAVEAAPAEAEAAAE